MNRVIMIKYGELTTKKGNRCFFVGQLYKNIKDKLKGFNVKVFKDLARMYIEFDESEEEKVLSRINKIFGIHEYLVAYKVESNIEQIKSSLLDIINNEKFNTFKVETKRSDKSFPINSLSFSSLIGSFILDNFSNIKVDVHNPDIIVNIEIRKEYTYIYTNSFAGLGGYPNGTLGKGILMLSGGIDSPVSGYMALKRGIRLNAVYFEAMPHTSIEARNKVIELSKKLSLYTNKIRLHIVPFTALQEMIYKNVDPSYAITIMRRMMYRITERLARRNKCYVIINGESIGQVASQTLTSMSVINNVTNMPVIRPVACFDKLEIIDIAKKIDTYETSILPYEDCCTLFVPKHPVINPILSYVVEMEGKFPYQEEIDKIFKDIYTIDITEEYGNKYESLL